MVIAGDETVWSPIIESLKSLGFENVVGAVTGGTALWHLAREPKRFSIVVLDIFLSDMSAKTFVDKIPERHGIETLIFLNGSQSGDLAAARSIFEQLSISKIGHLKKPGALEQFRELLERYPPETDQQPD